MAFDQTKPDGVCKYSSDYGGCGGRLRSPTFLHRAHALGCSCRTRCSSVSAKGLPSLHRARRLPTMFGFREHVEVGGLVSYGVDLRESWRRAANFVDRILRGAKASELPVELPAKLELVINQGTAKALGLRLSLSVLARADEVIE